MNILGHKYINQSCNINGEQTVSQETDTLKEWTKNKFKFKRHLHKEIYFNVKFTWTDSSAIKIINLIDKSKQLSPVLLVFKPTRITSYMKNLTCCN